MCAALPRFSTPVRLILASAVVLSMLFIVAIHVGRAATPIIVTTTNDVVKTDGYCSLREAIIAANKDVASSPADCPAGSGTDTIIIPAGTYTLTRTDNGKEDAAATGDLDITSNIIISPTGPVTITAISGFSDRIFQVIAGSLTINNVTIMNGNVTGDGAAIYVGTGAALTLTNSTLTNNTASDHGGGIASAGNLTLINDTISGNKILKTNSANYGGGGLYLLGGTTTAVNVTIANNTANTQVGSGGNVRRVAGTLTLKNTLIANAVSGGNCAGTFTSAGNNLSSDSTCSASLNQAGDLNNVNPLIGALLNNGGWTMTYALPLNSPAVDAGTNAGCPTIDQRGLPRPIGLSCDIGSYENQDPLQHGPIITVNKPGDIDDGACTYLDCKLREAINLANAQPNGSTPDQIQFKLPGPGPYTIYLSSTLPAITSPAILDGATQPGGSLTVDGSTATAGSDCFLINGNGSTLKNLIIRNCPATCRH